MEPALPPEDSDRETRVIDLRSRQAGRRLPEVEAELATLRDRLAVAALARDRLAEQLAGTRTALREAQDQLRAARQQVTDRLAGEVRALVALGEVRTELATAQARLEARDDSDAVLARLSDDLAEATRVAREDIDRHLAARVEAEARLAAAEAELRAVRSQSSQTQAARRAELDQLRAAGDRLRAPQSGPDAPEGVIVELSRAAERLRLQTAEAPAPAASAPTWPLLRRARVRRLLAALGAARR